MSDEPDTDIGVSRRSLQGILGIAKRGMGDVPQQVACRDQCPYYYMDPSQAACAHPRSWVWDGMAGVDGACGAAAMYAAVGRLVKSAVKAHEALFRLVTDSAWQLDFPFAPPPDLLTRVYDEAMHERCKDAEASAKRPYGDPLAALYRLIAAQPTEATEATED